MGLWRQFLALGKKNWLLTKRNWKGTVAQLVSPLAIMLMLLAFQGISDYVLSRQTPEPPIQSVGPSLPQCIPPLADPSLGCTTLLWGPAGVPWVEQVMRSVANATGLDFDSPSDMSSFGNGTALDGKNDFEALQQRFLKQPNTTIGK